MVHGQFSGTSKPFEAEDVVGRGISRSGVGREGVSGGTGVPYALPPADPMPASPSSAPSPGTPPSGAPFASAVLVAAGRSTRMGGATRKPAILLAGRSVLERTLDAFRAAGTVAQIVVVVHADDLDDWRARLADDIVLVAGGAERTDSVRAGVNVTTSEVVLVHDAARCLVRPERLDQVAQAARADGAALLAVPVRDTLHRASEGRAVEVVEREDLWAAQTPQAFRTDLLRSHLERAATETWTPTDDAALHERYASPVTLVSGDPDNLKLTTPADVALFEALLAARGNEA